MVLRNEVIVFLKERLGNLASLKLSKRWPYKYYFGMCLANCVLLEMVRTMNIARKS